MLSQNSSTLETSVRNSGWQQRSIPPVGERTILLDREPELIAFAVNSSIEFSQLPAIKTSAVLTAGSTGLFSTRLFLFTGAGRTTAVFQSHVESPRRDQPRHVQLTFKAVELRQGAEISEQLQFQPVMK